MTSKKQIIANRRNAKHSTGPSTKAGKERSRKNAYKHGLAAETLIIGDEEAAEFETFRDKMLLEYAPATILEHELVERLVGLSWRLRRIPMF